MFQLEHAIEAVECIDGMGDHEDAAAGGVLERASHHPARLGRVEVGDGFVEDQEACVGQQRSGQREALALAAGDELTLMADERVEAVLEPGDIRSERDTTALWRLRSIIRPQMPIISMPAVVNAPATSGLHPPGGVALSASQ